MSRANPVPYLLMRLPRYYSSRWRRGRRRIRPTRGSVPGRLGHGSGQRPLGSTWRWWQPWSNSHL